MIIILQIHKICKNLFFTNTSPAFLGKTQYFSVKIRPPLPDFPCRKSLTTQRQRNKIRSMLHKKDVNPIDTDASVSLALKQISNAFVKDANRTLKRIGLTVSQAEILLFLYHTRIQEVSQRDIESHFGLQHPTVIGLLERLRKKKALYNVPSTRKTGAAEPFPSPKKPMKFSRKWSFAEKRWSSTCSAIFRTRI